MPVRMCRDSPAGTCLSVPVRGWAYMGMAVPWVPMGAWTCLWVQTCMGEGTHTCVDIHARMRGAGGVCVQGGTYGSLGVPQAGGQRTALMHNVRGGACFPYLRALACVRVMQLGMASPRLSAQPLGTAGGSKRKRLG